MSRRMRRQVVGEGGGGGSDVGVEVGVRGDAVGPGESHPLTLVLHPSVLEPHLHAKGEARALVTFKATAQTVKVRVKR